MYNKHLLALIWAMTMGMALFAQTETPQLANISPPSPTAASLGKYGDVPVSYNIGAPSITVPIHEINSQGLSTPIYLSYHASGIRVDDNASWVGMGWSLNAGGVITRSVRGSADDASNGLLNNVLPTENQINDPAEEINLTQFFGPQTSHDGEGVKDREPDLFYFNFMGSSGKLYFDENGDVVTKPYGPIKIEPHFYGGRIDTWTITDQNGIEYYFGADNNTISGLGKEITSTGNQPSYVSAWYLVRAFNPRTNTNIYFEYDDLTSKVEKPKNQSLEWYFHQPMFSTPEFGGLNELPQNPDFQSPSQAKTTVYGNRILSRILFPNGKVEFTTTADRTDIEDEVELDKIEVFTGNSLLKSFHFNYDFIGKLYLTGIDEYDDQTASYKSHVFEYETKIPNGASNDQDFWGFYNAAGNSSLIPQMYSVNNPYGQYQADRLPNETAMKSGVLKKIIYPTKGSTEFIFEAHKAFTPQNSDPYSPFLLNNKVDVSLTSVLGEYKESLFSIETQNSQNILFDIDFTYFREVHNTNRPAAYLHKLENGQWTEIRSWWPSYPATQDESFDTSIELQPGDYRFMLTDMPCATPPCYVPQPHELEKRFVTNAKFSYLSGTTTDLKNTEITVGGLRIQKIVDRDSNGSLLTQRKYTYENGKVISFPIHYFSYAQEIYSTGYYNTSSGCWIGTQLDDYEIHSISSNSLAVLGASQGSHVIYAKVTEEQLGSSNQNNGVAEYLYHIPDFSITNPNNIPYEPPYAPQKDVSDIANKLELQVFRNVQGDTVRTVRNNFSFVDPRVPSHPVSGLSIHQKRKRVRAPQGSCSSLGQYTAAQSHFYDYAFYDTETSWIKLASMATTDFDTNGQNPVTVNTIYQYENPDHLQVTLKETVTSDGETIKTRTFYPDDVILASSLGSPNLGSTDQQAITRLNGTGHHRIAEPVQTETTVTDAQGNTLSRTVNRTLYKDWDADLGLDINTDLVLPKAMLTLKGNYDATANPMQERINYHGYDSYGNPVDVSRTSGAHAYYVWGYQGQYPIAKIENFDTNAVTTAIQQKIDSAETASDADNDRTQGSSGNEGALRTALNALRAALPADALMTGYTYDPLIGVTSITDAKGYTTYYQYDGFNRLKAVRDAGNQLMEDYKYHYKGE